MWNMDFVSMINVLLISSMTPPAPIIDIIDEAVVVLKQTFHYMYSVLEMKIWIYWSESNSRTYLILYISK